MKKIIRSAAILSALAIVLTGCGERDRVTNIYESTVNAPLAQNTSSVTNESANKTNGESIANSTENSAPTSEISTVGINSGESSMPKDIIPEKNYEAFGELADIVEDSRTVEVLNAELAEYNREYPDYAVTSAEITDNGEPVTSGLLKNGMIIRFNYGGGGYDEFTVVRAPKDEIPDGTYEAFEERSEIVEDSRTVEELNAELAEYNREYPDYAVTSAEITDNGEPVTSGLLKNGMIVRFDHGDGYEEFTVMRAPKDIIPESNYEAFGELADIVEDSRTIEELNAELAEYNREYPDFAVTSAEITYDGEPVTSGLLKNGMIVRFDHGDGYEEFTVMRAPKDIIPESNYEAFGELADIVEDSRTIEELNAELEEYNRKYPDFATTSAEITDNGEPVTSGLLKNGMIVRFNYSGGGYEEFTVVRAPKDAIPDSDYGHIAKREDIVGNARTVEDLVREIEKFNRKYPDYAIDGLLEVTYNGEPVTSGALKNGMKVSFLFGGGVASTVVHHMPEDIIPESNYEAFGEPTDIVEDSRTVEELNAELAEYNREEYPDFVVTSAEITDNSEPVTSGLLKSGMRVRCNYSGGGYVEFTVARALRDIIP